MRLLTIAIACFDDTLPGGQICFWGARRCTVSAAAERVPRESMSYPMRSLENCLQARVRVMAMPMLALVSSGAAPAAAQTPEARLPSCLACHGEHGTSTNPEVPSLGGQGAPYMEIQLYLYRERMNRNDVMNEVMTGLSNEDLGTIADLLSRLPPPAAVKDGIDRALMDRGRALIHRNRCDVCHNPRSFRSREHSAHRRAKRRLPPEGVARV